LPRYVAFCHYATLLSFDVIFHAAFRHFLFAIDMLHFRRHFFFFFIYYTMLILAFFIAAIDIAATLFSAYYIFISLLPGCYCYLSSPSFSLLTLLSLSLLILRLRLLHHLPITPIISYT